MYVLNINPVPKVSSLYNMWSNKITLDRGVLYGGILDRGILHRGILHRGVGV